MGAILNALQSFASDDFGIFVLSVAVFIVFGFIHDAVSAKKTANR